METVSLDHDLRPFVSRAILLAALVLLFPSGTRAQQPDALRVVAARENFRAAANGAKIAEVLEGARLIAEGEDGRWREATLEGWLPASILFETDRDGFGLVVGRGGATLLRTPGGPEIGRALEGLLVEEAGRSGAWVRVRRTGWIWGPSVDVAEAEPAQPPPPADSAAVRSASAPAATVSAPPPAPPAAQRADGAATLLAAPEGDVLASLAPEAEYEVVGREGAWVRVRMEGWLPAAAVDTAGSRPGAPLQGVTLQMLRREPERFRGRVLSWDVQFVSLQRADSLRTDLGRGRSYILGRDPNGEPGLVYLVVPEDLLDEAAVLAPLERFRVTGRLRSGRSALVGHPILDVMEIRR